MLKWHSSLEKLQKYFDVLCKLEFFYELSTPLTFCCFALRCTKLNSAFIYDMGAWVLLVIKRNTLPLEHCEVGHWTSYNSVKWKLNKREKHAFINGKVTNFTFFCCLLSRCRWVKSTKRDGVRVRIGLNWNLRGPTRFTTNRVSYSYSSFLAN
jgi:hypothetical protein